MSDKTKIVCASFSGDIYQEFPVETPDVVIVEQLMKKAKRKGVEVHVIQELGSGRYLVE